MDDYQPNENEEKSPYPTTEAPGISLFSLVPDLKKKFQLLVHIEPNYDSKQADLVMSS